MIPTRRAVLAFGVLVWSAAIAFATLTAQSPAAPNPGPAAPRTTGPSPPLFAHSNECLACHNNLTTPSGEDVSIGASWRGSMMANAGRDPYFHASVRREALDHPSHAADIEDECATCHMPAGQRSARAAGQKGEVFRFLPAKLEPDDDELGHLATDGITCTVCHQVGPDRLGTRESFNGNFELAGPLPNGNRRIGGPFEPDAGRLRIMHSVTGFEQTQAPHIRQSELCATCHTLITTALGPNGQVIGSLPEQMNYLEWRHSAFEAEERSCQSCHMPLVQGPVRIASVLGLDRDHLARHTFIGGNAFMLRLMNRYRAELGVEATQGELESTARATIRQLETATATVAIDQAQVTGGTLAFDVAVTNLTGHKFPTGYPSRRAWLHVIVRGAQGQTLFESGGLSETARIDGNDGDSDAARFEPHHAEITQSSQVQIYESIMGTQAGSPTTGLLEATQYLKDNRLLPRGFDKATATNDIAVVGAAANDTDFSGAGDRVRYRVPIAGSGALTVDVELRFQPIGFRWAQNLAGYRGAEPQAFLTYYNSLAPSSSVVVATATRQLTR